MPSVLPSRALPPRRSAWPAQWLRQGMLVPGSTSLNSRLSCAGGIVREVYSYPSGDSCNSVWSTSSTAHTSTGPWVLFDLNEPAHLELVTAQEDSGLLGPDLPRIPAASPMRVQSRP